VTSAEHLLKNRIFSHGCRASKKVKTQRRKVMLSQLETARALKDKDYFRSLAHEEQQAALDAGGIGDGDVSDETLVSVSSGLEGGSHILYTSTGRSGCRSANKARMVICSC
jgi:hypothetical protein